MDYYDKSYPDFILEITHKINGTYCFFWITKKSG